MKNILTGLLTKKMLLIVSAISCTTLLVVTFVHIYIVTTPRSDSYVNSQVQLARLDIQGTPSHEETEAIVSIVKKSVGVRNAIINEHDKTVVYLYDIGQNTSENIQQLVNSYLQQSLGNGKLHVERYIVPATMQGSCPMNARQTGLFRSIGAYMHQVLD
ncbi:MAG: hypothetical protein JNJ85_07415 [Candidatus Kapabacteria bacterium]|nr:hypothetical protein [Candidatus Kapabacteria bacterium]